MKIIGRHRKTGAAHQITVQDLKNRLRPQQQPVKTYAFGGWKFQ